jgi:hypothetical protein
MAVSSYNAIGSVTVSASQTQITFSNISQLYTDLVLIITAKSSAAADIWIRANGDSTNSYSYIELDANGSTVASSKSTASGNGFLTDWWGTPSTDNSHVCIVNFNNYSNNFTYKTAISRANRASSGIDLVTSLWRKTSPINSLTLRFSNATRTFDPGTVVSLYGIGANTLKASGGDIVQTDGTYWYHAFKKSGTFTPNSALSCDVLVVAGGGSGGTGGGANWAGGGGGAGGLYYSTGNSISTAQTVTVGAGAGTASNSAGTDGSNSQFGSLTAAVGGGGGGYGADVASKVGRNGGSGGGGGYQAAGGTGTSGQGNAGGTATTTFGAGGGGAGVAGGGGVFPLSGTGGNGLNTYSSWLSVTNTGAGGYIAGGGSGGSYSNTGSAGAAGLGGGGAGSTRTSVPASNGVTNTGGGGGGSYASIISGAGGSGLVIVRYPV